MTANANQVVVTTEEYAFHSVHGLSAHHREFPEVRARAVRPRTPPGVWPSTCQGPWIMRRVTGIRKSLSVPSRTFGRSRREIGHNPDAVSRTSDAGTRTNATRIHAKNNNNNEEIATKQPALDSEPIVLTVTSKSTPTDGGCTRSIPGPSSWSGSLTIVAPAKNGSRRRCVSSVFDRARGECGYILRGLFPYVSSLAWAPSTFGNARPPGQVSDSAVP